MESKEQKIFDLEIDQLVNLAIDSEPPIPLIIVQFFLYAFLLATGIATAYCAVWIFTLNNQDYLWIKWVVGVIIGIGLGFVLYLLKHQLQLDSIRAIGEGIKNIIGRGIGEGIIRSTAILCCMIFTFGQLQSFIVKRENKALSLEQKISNLKERKEENRIRYENSRDYYRSLDEDGDPGNDDSARVELSRIEKKRSLEIEQERTEWDSLMAIKDTDNNQEVGMAEIDNTAAFRWASNGNDRAYWFMILIFSGIIGALPDIGVSVCGRIVSRAKAYDNLLKSITKVNSLISKNTIASIQAEVNKPGLINQVNVNEAEETESGWGDARKVSFDNKKNLDIVDRLNEMLAGEPITQEMIAAEFKVSPARISVVKNAAETAGKLKYV